MRPGALDYLLDALAVPTFVGLSVVILVVLWGCAVAVVVLAAVV